MVCKGQGEVQRTDSLKVIFIKTLAPVHPVALVQLICKDYELGHPINRSRYLQRLTPITVTGKATERGIEEVAKAVVQPVLGASCPARQVRLDCLSEEFVASDEYFP